MSSVSSANNSITPPGLSPLAEVWRIAWPTVVTMTSYTVMQFVDKLMVAQVGPLEVAAQGNGGIWAFTPIAVIIGFLTVINTYVSQNLGAGTPERGPQYAWAALWICLAVWIVVLLPFAAMLPWVFTFIHDPAEVADLERLIAMESGYGQILLVGAIVTLAGRAMHHYFFGLHRPKVITVSAAIGNAANIVFNYIFIFGSDGIPALGLPGVPGVPAMGVYGAALGTVLGTAIELAIPFAIFVGPEMHRELNARASWRPRWAPMRDLFRIGWPAATQYGNELVCWAIFMTVLVGMFGEDHMTAGWIALGFMHLSFMPALGFSTAVTSLVGKYIGAGDPDTAVARARFGVGLAAGYMTVCAIVFLVFRHQLVSIFVSGDATPEQAANIISIGGKLMICAAIFQTFDAVAIVYSGALRGVGDTVWPGVITMIYSWLFIVGAGYALVIYAPGLESVGPWIGAATFIIAIGVTMAWRFESGRWRSIKLLHDRTDGAASIETSAADVAPIGPAAPAGSAEASVRDIAEEIADEYAARR